jgi:uncharacterized protein (TIGR03435 family)
MPAPTVRTGSLALTLCLVYGVYGQTGDKPLTFDVASVKPVAPLTSVPDGGDGAATRKKGDGIRGGGGPGTNDPGRIHYPRISLKALLVKAYDVKFPYQIEGPAWLDTELFEIDATMPPDTTKQQFCLMLQNLLSQRFKMAIHRETKGFPGYALVVAKNGPKLKESVNIPPPQSNTDPQPLTAQQMLTALRSQPRDAYGFPKSSPDPKLAGGRAGVSSIMNERGWCLYGQQQTMHDLANLLPNWANLNAPVADATGLSSKYDFAFTFLPEGTPASHDYEPPPDIFGALQSQLGLKLEPKKVPVEVIVVDHMEKTATAN